MNWWKLNSAKCKNTNLRLIGVIASEWVLNKFWSNFWWKRKMRQNAWKDEVSKIDETQDAEKGTRGNEKEGH